MDTGAGDGTGISRVFVGDGDSMRKLWDNRDIAMEKGA